MSLFPRRKPQGKPTGPVSLVTGTHRSPGMTIVAADVERRPPENVLDLGPSSSENLAFLTRFTDNISILDIAGSDQLRAPRAAPLTIDVDELRFGHPGVRFDLILLWDLLHYVARREAPRFSARLVEVCRPGTLVLLLASASAPIPPVPLRFRILDREHLLYEVLSDERIPAPGWTVRDVEKTLAGFEPVRYFQLRNGLQEFVFRFLGDGSAVAAAQS